MLVGVSDNDKCVNDAMVSVCMKATPQVTLYEPHTAEESLRRRRSARNSQVLPDHPGQERELLHVLLPPHQRVCVKGHLRLLHRLPQSLSLALLTGITLKKKSFSLIFFP